VWFIAGVTVLVLVLDRADKVATLETASVSAFRSFLTTLQTQPAQEGVKQR